MLTVAFMADALTRSGTIRYGNAYIGRVVTELLGRPGALVLTIGLVGICLMGMQADYIGVSATLTDVTGVPAVGFVALLFCVELLYLRRGSIDATVTSALVVGAVNITLILAICALAFAHADASNLAYVELPFVGDAGFDRSSLALVFGVTFTAFFGHLSVSNCARVVLARDPGGRTLVRGVVGAQLTAIVLYVVFVVAVAGAVSPDVLAAEAGTALSPLADEAGALVLALGGVLVVLGMGMASIHSALALFYLVRERLPSLAPRTLVLPRRGARLVLSGGGRRGGPVSVVLTYVGVARGGGARLRLDVGGPPARAVEGIAPAGAPWEPFEQAAPARPARPRPVAARGGAHRVGPRGPRGGEHVAAAALRGRLGQRGREHVRALVAVRRRRRGARLAAAPARRDPRPGRRADRARRGGGGGAAGAARRARSAGRAVARRRAAVRGERRAAARRAAAGAAVGRAARGRRRAAGRAAGARRRRGAARRSASGPATGWRASGRASRRASPPSSPSFSSPPGSRRPATSRSPTS